MNTSSAFVAIVGRPNVGKSSLMNYIMEEKIAIVSDKPQTTRTRIMGVLTKDAVQLVFIDTPGLHKPKNKLGEYMVQQVENSIGDVDLIVMVSEALGDITTAEKKLIENIQASGLPAILVLNKIDAIKQKDEMMPKLEAFSQMYKFEDIIPISALAGDGVDILLQKLTSYAEPGPHFFPDDTLTDQPERVIVSEIVREKILINMRDEIPHGTAVAIEQMKERDGRQIMDIDVTIMCEKSSHKGMIIGKNGAMLKKIATDARKDIETFLEVKVNLQCWVKVKEDWRNKEMTMKSLGFQ
ncbi:MAG: GTPase Era [Oscillospiraceae bacterium]